MTSFISLAPIVNTNGKAKLALSANVGMFYKKFQRFEL